MKRKIIGVVKTKDGSFTKEVNGSMEMFDDDWLFEVKEPKRTDGKGNFLYDYLFSLGHRYGYFCFVCKEKMSDWKPQYCCDGRQCGCYGQPIEPPICSAECWEIILRDYKNCKHMWR